MSRENDFKVTLRPETGIDYREEIKIASHPKTEFFSDAYNYEGSARRSSYLTVDTSKRYLVMQKTTSGQSRAVVRSIPFEKPFNLIDFGALFVLHQLHRYSSANSALEVWETGVFRHTGLAYDAWLLSLSYLFDASLFQSISPLIAPEKFPSEIERLEFLAASLHAVGLRTKSIPQDFADRGYRYEAYQVGCLVDAAFHADLAVVKYILENSKHPKTLLTISGEVIVDGHPDIKRHGTALQMALRSGDAPMVHLMCSYLQYREYKRQFESVFGADFEAFRKKQKKEADALFRGMGTAFYIFLGDPLTSWITRAMLRVFKSALEEYTLKNPAHNDFILLKAYEFYIKRDKTLRTHFREFFMPQVIGLIQEQAKKTSLYDLQLYAMYNNRYNHLMSFVSDGNGRLKRHFFFKSHHKTDLNCNLIDVRTMSFVREYQDVTYTPRNEFIHTALQELFSWKTKFFKHTTASAPPSPQIEPGNHSQHR